MTREDYVKSLIKARGYTFKAFAQEINMPYTTLLSILNGSIGGAAMDNVLRISQALDFTIEELNDISNPPREKGSTQADDDEDLLKLIHNLPEDKKRALKILLTSH
ncbi:MAG: helix-turn-helix transcriptional regulator [Selenomonas sp.]|nr:helix-turn-helix transcriptional regulator [Selenomonas sp.]